MSDSSLLALYKATPAGGATPAPVTGTGAVLRPLSPHLTVYAPQYGSVFSITMRITGVVLIFPTLALFLAPYGLALPALDGVMGTFIGLVGCGLSLLGGVLAPLGQTAALGSSLIPVSFVGGVVALLLWGVIAYHVMNPTMKMVQDEYYLGVPNHYSPEFFNAQKVGVLVGFAALFIVGVAFWGTHLMLLGQTGGAEILMAQDDLGPLFDRS